MTLFNQLGFEWQRSAVPKRFPVHSIARVCFRFHKMLPEFVWDASVLEGNPFTFIDVKTLMDGITVGGHRVSDQEQVLNLAESSKKLLSLVKSNTFSLDKQTFCSLHALVARNEALEWGHFRGEGEETDFSPKVSLGEGRHYSPLPTLKGAAALNKQFKNGLHALAQELTDPFEKASAFFLFGALQQFFFDGNKRTSRLMMNGVLMSSGIDAISIPAAKASEFNQNMVDFYLSKDATSMMTFLAQCHPEIEQTNRTAVYVGTNPEQKTQIVTQANNEQSESLLSKAETTANEQRALLENALLEQALTATLKPYVEAKHAQIERIETRLTDVIERQQTKLQQTENNPPKPKWYASKKTKAASESAWRDKCNQRLARLHTLNKRKHDLGKIKQGTDTRYPTVEELATRKMRRDHPELAASWDAMRESVRLKQQQERQQREKQVQQTQSQGQGQGYSLSHRLRP